MSGYFPIWLRRAKRQARAIELIEAQITTTTPVDEYMALVEASMCLQKALEATREMIAEACAPWFRAAQ